MATEDDEYPFLPKQNRAAANAGVRWTFDETAFQDGYHLMSLLQSNPDIMEQEAQKQAVAEILNYAAALALEATYATPGYVSSDTLNAFDNALLKFDSGLIQSETVANFFNRIFGLEPSTPSVHDHLLQPLYGANVKF